MAKVMTYELGLQLLSNGNSLTANGKDLDTLTKRKDGMYQWKGIHDRGATIFSENRKALHRKGFSIGWKKCIFNILYSK